MSSHNPNLIWDHFLTQISPIACLIGAALIFTILEGLSFRGIGKLKSAVALFGTLGALCCTLWLSQGASHFEQSFDLMDSAPRWLVAFKQAYVLDDLSLSFYLAIGLFTLLSIVMMTLRFSNLPDEGDPHRSDVELLVLFIASGMMVLVSAGNLITLFLGLELLSLPTYALVGISQKDSESCEGALKYFLFGSLASVFLLLGSALLFAQFSSLQFAEIARGIQLSVAGTEDANPIFTYAALAFLISAAAFKIGAAPFHMWVPDAYQGAPTPVTGFMGSAIKLAGFALVLRLMWDVFLPVVSQWRETLAVLAVISMFFGNIAAVTQDNLKRLFAFSSVAHAGYLLVGVLAVGTDAPSTEPIFYYLLVYGLMFIGIFGILAIIEKNQKSLDIYELSGLGFQRPYLSAALAILVLSAAGIPPTAGFLAKYFLFYLGVKSGNTLVVVLAVISSLIGVYYYLRVLVFLYLRESHIPFSMMKIPRTAFACVLFCALAMLALAVKPDIWKGTRSTSAPVPTLFEE